MNERIELLKSTIEPLRQEIIHHPVYTQMHDLDDLKVFMHFHSYAVWDFMSLLKTLQNKLTCTNVPWFPTGSADTRFLINEIVTGEESDVDPNGNRKSHFELYQEAMRQCGADTASLETFTATLQQTGKLDAAFQAAQTPIEARDFVDFTFRVIATDKPHVQSAVFTFGREDLIPGMFFAIINDIHHRFPETVSIFKYYLERHIEVDGDHHSHLALQMTANLCGDNNDLWQEAERATIDALRKRIRLWDGVARQLAEQPEVLPQLT
ncbi:DUF3050 domain-containing protein [Larkinella sp. VNQ87]|uniref:DUF3050 domain-containing protein n=1 Tax=Larkinella sp. VNQ87 TaxID=3400921 RepID=UPI003BFFF07B